MSIIPHGRKDLRGCICLDAIAASHHDESNDPNEQHHRHTLGPSPCIQYLCQRDLAQAANNIGHDACGGREGMKSEGAGHIRIERANDNLLYGCDKVNEPDTMVDQY